MTTPFFPSFDQLPASLPVFPLPGALLLPRGDLPLNIFEPRYIAMVDDALAGDRLIGMAQPRSGEMPGDTPSPIYDVGCAGRITALEETDDGRYLITLSGVARFAVGAEVATTRGYRRFEVDWSAYAGDLDRPGQIDVDRDRLMQALSVYFRQNGISANWDAIEKTPEDRLVTSLAMICPFGASEKQALLEADSLTARAELVISLMEMATFGQQGGDQSRH
jgi:hypothetical protein